MLEIVSTDQIVKSMELAAETKTEEQLIHWLLYLSTWGGADTVVRAGASLPASSSFIDWAAYRVVDGVCSERPYFNGGLVFHHSLCEWSVHS